MSTIKPEDRKRQGFIITVRVLVRAEDGDEAFDRFNDLLADASDIIDWRFPAKYLPEPCTVEDIEEYEQGTFDRVADERGRVVTPLHWNDPPAQRWSTEQLRAELKHAKAERREFFAMLATFAGALAILGVLAWMGKP